MLNIYYVSGIILAKKPSCIQIYGSLINLKSLSKFAPITKNGHRCSQLIFQTNYGGFAWLP